MYTELARERTRVRVHRFGATRLAKPLALPAGADYPDPIGDEDIRRAFHEGIISDGDARNEMHIARNHAAHLYDEERADRIVVSGKDHVLSQDGIWYRQGSQFVEPLIDSDQLRRDFECI